MGARGVGRARVGPALIGEWPVGGFNGATPEAGELSGDGNCFVPCTTVRFSGGAILSEFH
jgi:hypothetical protein